MGLGQGGGAACVARRLRVGMAQKGQGGTRAGLWERGVVCVACGLRCCGCGRAGDQPALAEAGRGVWRVTRAGLWRQCGGPMGTGVSPAIG